MLEATWTASADRDLGRILAYLDAHAAGGTGDRFLEQVLTVVDDLRHHPNLGVVSRRVTDPTVREFVIAPFHSVFYRTDRLSVVVLRVWDHRRSPEEFFVDNE